MRLFPTHAAALGALTLLAACDGGGTTTPARLTADQVAGTYQVCELRFSPANTILPTADLLKATVDTTPPPGRVEFTVAFSQAGEYDLIYTRASDAFIQQARGSVDYGAQHVSISMPANSPITSELLLPRPLNLRFTGTGGKRLTAEVSDNLQYPVNRADYARAAGVSEEGLQPTINGRLTATLAVNGCG
ncbi:MAG: hypothetical protein AVDCRST_MAG89-238 [uncultured Gemmatimonadetes bacterium]|uniref:Lipoprotein n=1 Tax=uncultured Gemmatimonadota bacterium TaxID=203437 RepID=A0A6J4K8Q0_9BACT|nr:MAG: hypothetical protein AVDCRST_MAG89-238 [uncultured Gemmatimonadota bacterium]